MNLEFLIILSMVTCVIWVLKFHFTPVDASKRTPHFKYHPEAFSARAVGLIGRVLGILKVHLPPR